MWIWVRKREDNDEGYGGNRTPFLCEREKCMKDITKQDTLVLKGIAIIMMMFHHNFRDVSFFENYSVSFWPFQQYQIVSLSVFFKICVSIFVFVSGYGLTLSYKRISKEYKLKRKELVPWLIQRLIKVLSGYWFVFVLASIICQLIDGRTWDVYFSEGILFGMYQYAASFFGLSRIMNLPLLVNTWWYMSAAVVFVFFVPIFNCIAKNYLGYGTALFIFWMIPHFLNLEYPGSTKALPFTLILFFGCTCAEYKIFGKLKVRIEEYSSGIKRFPWIAAALVLFYLCFKEYSVFMKEGLWEVSLAVIPLIVIFLSYMYICPIPYVNKVLAFLGKHSMNIFLTHTFIRWVYLRDFTYSWGHFMIINIVLVLISLGISYVIELLKRLLRYDSMLDKVIQKGCHIDEI